MKRFLLGLLALGIVLLPMGAMAEMGTGKVSAKSSDINIEMFGSLKVFPHFMDNVDFNSDDTKYDYIGDENGAMSEHSIRNELRVGWQGGNDNWDFLVILEADVTLNKYTADRGVESTNFGVEKLNFGYNFDAFKLNTGWTTKFLDINSGGILYGDDHPYIGLSGKYGSMNWEALYLIVQDDIEEIKEDDEIKLLHGETLDWRVYTLRAGFDMNGFTLAPMYAFSDNNDHDADVHYLGVEGYGKVGDFTPRFEVVWATGDQDVGAQEYDVDAWAAYASVDFNYSDAFTPYIGGYYMTGDSDANDDDIEAFNGITNISRYTSTFGMENAFIYRVIPALGCNLYSNAPNMLGGANGYGGIGNSSSRNAPGLLMGGLGAKGTMDKFSYKAQFMYFAFEEEGALESLNGGVDIDDELGMEFDLQLTYKFGKHFSIGNVLAIFDPGDAVKDIRGDDFDETAILDTVEFTWTF